MPEITAPQLEAAREHGQSFGGRLKGGAIAIASKQPSSRRARLQNGRRVSTPTDRAVGVMTVGLWMERRQHLRHHDRVVDVIWHRAWIA